MDSLETEPEPAALMDVAPELSQADASSAMEQQVGGPHRFHLVDTLQTVLTALILAFIFRAFFVEAFIIPTGSMAEGLHGAHGTRTCPACGFEYHYGVPAAESLCPNCHLRAPLPKDAPTKSGDRILVHKWPCALGGCFPPRRWEVIVFRNPSDPDENYIKRAVGLPGETVEIIDGDVFIDGRIARKPASVQQALWFVVFDQNHFPAPAYPAVGGPRWVPDPPGDSAWSGLCERVLRCRALRNERPSEAPDEAVLRFQPADARYFQDVYGYNRGPSVQAAPLVGDLRLLAELTIRSGSGYCRFEFDRDGYRFTVQLDCAGRATLLMTSPGGQVRVIATRLLPHMRPGRPYVVELAHLDYRVYFRLDGGELLATTDDDYAPSLADLRSFVRTQPVGISIAAADVDLELRGLRLERDVYYTYRPGYTQRAHAGRPFVLDRDEYFVLGDNSPDSRDSREWTEAGPHVPPDYRLGTVRAEQIVGPAAFVYLPGLLPQAGPLGVRLPDIGRMRFVR